MYLITYVDRVNVSTAAAGFAKDFDLNKTKSAWFFPLCLSLSVVPDHRRLGERPVRHPPHPDYSLVWAPPPSLRLADGDFAFARVAGLARRACRHRRHVRWVAAGPDFAQGVTIRQRAGQCARARTDRAVMAVYGWRASFCLRRHQLCLGDRLVFHFRSPGSSRHDQAQRDLPPPK